MGWALDAFDVMLFSLVLASVIADSASTKTQAGALGSVTLARRRRGRARSSATSPTASAARARMIASVLLYSVFTAACGLSQTLWQFAVFRALLGLGMGGEWASGAALVSETWPATHRGRALGFMQSAWAIGFAAAALVVGVRPAALGLAGRVLRRHPAGAVHAVGPPQRRGARGVEGAAARRARPARRAAPRAAVRRHFPRAHATPHGGGDVHERLRAVRLVGAQRLDPGLPLAPAGAGRPRPRHQRCRGSSSRCRSACGSATSRSATSPMVGRKRVYVLPGDGERAASALRRR